VPYDTNNSAAPKRIAIIGSGIAGMSAAWLLNRSHEITLFEGGDHIGGHSNTVNAGSIEHPLPVDTGFIVYNEKNYPNLVALFDHLGVPTKPTNMTFAASIDAGRFEYSGTGLNGLLGQRRNMFSPRFWAMISDLIRFYKTAPTLADKSENLDLTLGDFLAANKYSDAFTRDHILPMGAAIWSTTANDMLNYPLAAFVRFFESHGLLKLVDRPQWRTVDGGSTQYVHRLTQSFSDKINRSAVTAIRRNEDGVFLQTTSGEHLHFDEVVIATHADDALSLLSDPSDAESKLLRNFRYTKNETYLHTDEQLMPKQRRVWSAWNYIDDGSGGDDRNLTVTYWMNQLQGINKEHPLFVTLNPHIAPKSSSVIRKFSYHHPLFDKAAMAAQKTLWSLQGRNKTWFCGSYFGYGFHEDALQTGLAVAEQISGNLRPWKCSDDTPRISTEINLPLAAD
jgi:uncharacterized protein